MKNHYGRLPQGRTIRQVKAELSPTNRSMIDEYTAFKRGSVTDKRLP